MKRLTASLMMASVAAVTMAALPAPVATAQTVSSPAREIVLSIGKGQLVTVPGSMTDVFVADEKVADVQVKSRSQLYVFGKSGGETTVYASNAAGDIIWSSNVRVGSNIGSVDQMLGLAMPEANISVATMGTNTILLTGTVASPEDAAEAQRLVAAFVGEDTNVVTRLRMATPLQVNLQVKFAEVSRSLVRTIGTNLTTVDGTSGFRFGVGTTGREGVFTDGMFGGPLGVGTQLSEVVVDATGKIVEEIPQASVTPNTRGSTLGFAGELLGLDILGALDLAERQGLVTTLSQPNLTALSGETADFLAGGEFPIPLSQGLGTTTIEYKRFGVSLAYTPTVLANGRISLRVRPEVSELSTQGSISLNGFIVPALTVRRAETTIELGSGQSFMIAGLMSASSQNTLDKAPGVGDLPILGNLFRSSDFRRGETELVIVVTPYLVKPVNANDIRLPTDGFRSPTELQRHLLFRESDGISGGDRPKPTARTTNAAPRVSNVDNTMPAPAPANEAPRQAARSEDAVPGFSFNTKGN